MELFNFDTLANELSPLFILVGMDETRTYKVSELRDIGSPILDAALIAANSKRLKWKSQPQVIYRKVEVLREMGFIEKVPEEGPLRYRLNKRKKPEIDTWLKRVLGFILTIDEAFK